MCRRVLIVFTLAPVSDSGHNQKFLYDCDLGSIEDPIDQCEIFLYLWAKLCSIFLCSKICLIKDTSLLKSTVSTVYAPHSYFWHFAARCRYHLVQ